MYRRIFQLIAKLIFKMAAVKLTAYFNFTAQYRSTIPTFRTCESVKYAVMFLLLSKNVIFFTNLMSVFKMAALQIINLMS